MNVSYLVNLGRIHPEEHRFCTFNVSPFIPRRNHISDDVHSPVSEATLTTCQKFCLFALCKNSPAKISYLF